MLNFFNIKPTRLHASSLGLKQKKSCIYVRKDLSPIVFKPGIFHENSIAKGGGGQQQKPQKCSFYVHLKLNVIARGVSTWNTMQSSI